MSKERIPSGLTKDAAIKTDTTKYLQKTTVNLMTMDVLLALKNNKEARNLLNIPPNYTPDDWIVVTGYYAMYLATTALLAKIGYKTKQHTAAINGLEHFFVKKKLLEQQYVDMLKSASLSHEEVHKLREARDDRETAQYGVTKATTMELIAKTVKNAHDFVDKTVSILQS